MPFAAIGQTKRETRTHTHIQRDLIKFATYRAALDTLYADRSHGL